MKAENQKLVTEFLKDIETLKEEAMKDAEVCGNSDDLSFHVGRFMGATICTQVINVKMDHQEEFLQGVLETINDYMVPFITTLIEDVDKKQEALWKEKKTFILSFNN